MDKQYFRELFKFHSTDNDTLSWEGLQRIFVLVEFSPSEDELVDYNNMFKNKDEITFTDFLSIFTLKGNNDLKK